jgi:polar amino acid transport system permease protein
MTSILTVVQYYIEKHFSRGVSRDTDRRNRWASRMIGFRFGSGAGRR